MNFYVTLNPLVAKRRYVLEYILFNALKELLNIYNY